MTLLCTRTLELELKDEGRNIKLQPGQSIELPDHRARRLLELAPDHVKPLSPGYVVEWMSPLFGRVSGKIQSVTAEMVTIGEHGVLKDIVTIPAGWIESIIQE